MVAGVIMQIELFNNLSESNRVNKSSFLRKITGLNGTLRNACSVVNPSVIIELDPNKLQQSILKHEFVVDSDLEYVTTNGLYRVVYDFITQVLSANYIHIPEFNRFYFITNITSIKNNLWQIDCKCDVLMSYAAEIRDLHAIVERQENVFNKYIPDPMLSYSEKWEITETVIENDVFKTDTPIAYFTVLNVVEDK